MQPLTISDSQVISVEISTTQPGVDIPPAKEQPVKPQIPPVSQATQKESDEKVDTQISEQETENEQEKEKINKVTSAEPVKSLVIQQTDEDDDDSLGISGPIIVDNTSASEIMNIATVMQSRAHKKRLKEQRMEAETIQNVVDILTSLLPETATGYLTTPICKLGKLVANASDQLKSLEEETQTYAEKSYRKKCGEQLMKEIDTGKNALSLNKDLLSKAIETRGKILASTSNVSFFYFDINNRRIETEQELEKICNAYVPLQDSVFSFGKFVDDLQNRLDTYDFEKAKDFDS